MNKIINQYTNFSKLLDDDIIKLSKKCLRNTLLFCIIASLFLIFYKIYYIPFLFIIGATLLKYGLMYCIIIIIFSLAFNTIKKDL